MHAHTHVFIKRIHVQELKMAAPMEASMFIMFKICVHVCMHMQMCVLNSPTQPPTPKGWNS